MRVRTLALLMLQLTTAWLLGAGCVKYEAVAETRISEDGTITRRFRLTGPDGKDCEDPLWLTFAKPEPEGWETAAITDKRIELAGAFGPKTPVPIHYRLAERPGQPGSESRIGFQCRDYILMAEYRFEEVITNSVSYEEFRRAGRELVSLYWDLAKQAMMEDLGERYELDKLFAFVENDLAKLASDLSDAYYWGMATQKTKAEIQRDMTRICAAAGIPLDFTQRDSQAAQRVLRLALRNSMEEYVRMKGAPAGAAMTPEQINQLVDYFDVSANRPFSLAASIPRVAAARLGNAEELGKRTDRLLKTCMGAYHGVPRTRFSFILQMPGRIISTNGLIEEPTRAAWRFEGSDTFPAGYRMTARSILQRSDIQQKIAGKALFPAAADAVAFLEKGDALDDAQFEEFRAAMQSAVESGDFEPLRKLAASGDKAPAEFAGAVLAMIGK